MTHRQEEQEFFDKWMNRLVMSLASLVCCIAATVVIYFTMPYTHFLGLPRELDAAFKATFVVTLCAVVRIHVVFKTLPYQPKELKRIVVYHLLMSDND